MQPALVVFDLDGTLIDSAPDMHRAVNLMLDGLGCAPLSLPDIRSMVGDGASALIARALAARQCVTVDPTEALALFLEHYEAEPTAFTRTFPDVHTTLERLRAHGLMLALCTNKPARLTGMILERLEIEKFFVRVIAGDSLPFRKPDPRALLAVLTGFDTPSAATIMAGITGNR
jgi:phosphoglycolate phosphatase